jgi:excisionase family DNA binding protein
MHTDKLAYSLKELASSLGVSVGFLRIEVRRGVLSTIRLGRRIVVPTDLAHRYLAEKRSAIRESR